MNGNIVKLVFDCISKGSGWADLRKNAADSLKNMNQLGGAFKSVAISAGAMGGVIGRAISAFAMGNVWGLAAEGMRFAIEKLGIFKDTSAEAKEQLDKLNAATEKYYATIQRNAKEALDKIDKETSVLKERLDITNRMVKAELELQRARAVDNGDIATANEIQDRIDKQDGLAAMDKAEMSAKSAEMRVKQAESDLATARKDKSAARKALNDAEEALARKSKPVTTMLQSTTGSIAYTQYQDTSKEKAAVDAAKKRLEAAEKSTDLASKSVVEERRKWNLAKDGVAALAMEQKAAEAKAIADKELADKKAAEDKAAAERKATEEWQKKVHQDQLRYAEEEARKKAAEQKKADEEAKRKQREESLKKTKDELDRARKVASAIEQQRDWAAGRVAETKDIIGNAAAMDQAGDIESASQARHTEERYAKRREALQKRLDRVGGDASKLGRLSNLDKATLNRMTAEKQRDSATDELKKLNDKFEKLSQKLEAATTL